MEGKLTAVILTILVVIILFLVLRYKIRSDKKRKSLAIPYEGIIVPKEKKSINASIPSFVLAIICLVIFTLVTAIVDEFIDGTFAMALFGLLSATACYLIIKQYPKSVWYVPLIINAIFIIAAFFEPNFWKRPPDFNGIPMWLPVFCAWILTIIASIIGVWQGNKKAAAEDH